MNERYKSAVLSLIGQLKQLELDPANCGLSLKLQLALRSKIVAVERTIRTQDKQIVEFKRAIRAGGRSKQESQKVKARLAHAREHRGDNDALIRRLRAIGDGIAYLYFDRWDLKPLAFKESPGFISGKQGGVLEVAVLRRLLRNGIPAVLSDITNVLRYGDVVVADGGPPRFIEVKKSRLQDARRVRQFARVTKIAEYLHADKTDELYGHVGAVQRKALSEAPQYHVDQFNELIAAAYANGEGIAFREFEPGQLFFAMAPHTADGALDKFLAQIPRYGKAYVTYLNTGKDTWASYYPFTLQIHSAHHVYDFMAGHLALFALWDFDVFARHLDDLGFQAKPLQDDDWAIELTPKNPVSPDYGPLRISGHLMSRLAFECFSLKSLARAAVDRVYEVFESGTSTNGPHKPMISALPETNEHKQE